MTESFFRSDKDKFEFEDLVYPIYYRGPETKEKKILDKIISKALVLKPYSFQYDEEYGEIVTFHSLSSELETELENKPELVTYVVSRKPFYNPKELTKLKKTNFFNTIFDFKSKEPFIKRFFESTRTEDLSVLYKFLNDGVELESDTQFKYAKKNIFHKLIAFFKDDKNSINKITNFMFDEDYDKL